MNKEICWNITARCNQGCKYCHRFLNINDLTYEENLKILNDLNDNGIRNITWTGGEALLLESIDKLLEESYKFGIKNKLISNGKLLDKYRMNNIFRYLDTITLSIDSIDSDINEQLGRGRNHFEEIKQILEYIKENKIDIKVRINSVICKKNIGSLLELSKFLEEYNISGWRIFKFMPLREKAIVYKNSFDISMDEYNDEVSSILKDSKIKNIETRVENDMENKYVLILANGDIMITKNGKDQKIGNALQGDIKRVIN